MHVEYQEQPPFVVMTGLDPAIHKAARAVCEAFVDPRVKPGDDGVCGVVRALLAIQQRKRRDGSPGQAGGRQKN